MAMDLVNLVQDVKQQMEGLFNTAVDANNISEDLEEHQVGKDRVDFVASLLMKNFGATSFSDVANSDGVGMSTDEMTLENKNANRASAGGCVDGTVFEDGGGHEASTSATRSSLKALSSCPVDLQAEVKVEMKPCNSKVDRHPTNNSDIAIISVPCFSGVSSTVNLPSSSNDLANFSMFDYVCDVNNNDPNNNTEYEVPHNSVSSTVNEPPAASQHEEDDDYSDVQFIDQEQVREKLLSETRIIHTVVPQRTFGEIYSFLESNLDNENRLQVVMKYFLNQDFPNVATAAGPNSVQNVPETSNATLTSNIVQTIPENSCITTGSNIAQNISEASSATISHNTRNFPETSSTAISRNTFWYTPETSSTTVSCNSAQNISKTSSAAMSRNSVKDFPGTSGPANTDAEPQDAIVVLSDSEMSDLVESDNEVVIQEDNTCEVVFVDYVGKNGKRRSWSKTESSPTKKSKVNNSMENSNDDSAKGCELAQTENLKEAIVDFSSNVAGLSKNFQHKHFNTVKEMFPNLGDRHLAKVCLLYGESDDDLVKIVDDLLQTVNSLGNFCEPVVEPLPTLGEDGLINQSYLDPFIGTGSSSVAEDNVAGYLGVKHVSNVEPKQNCIAVFQQTISERDGPSFRVTQSPSRHVSSEGSYVGSAPPCTSSSDPLDGSGSSSSTSFTDAAAQNSTVTSAQTVASAQAEPSRLCVDDANKLTSRGRDVDNADQAAGLTDTKAEEVAAIVAATCAKFMASAPAVNNGPQTRNKTKSAAVNHNVQFAHPPADQESSAKPDTQALADKPPSAERRLRSSVLDSANRISEPAKKRKKVLNVTSTPTTCNQKQGEEQVEPKIPRLHHREICTSTVNAPLDVLDVNNQPSTSGMQNNPPVTEAEPITTENAAEEVEPPFSDNSAQEQQKMDDRYECLLSIFPQADPTYLLDKCIEISNDEEKMRQFIADALEKKDYPTYQDYQNRMEVERQKKKVTTEFSVESFLEIFPDPLKYFLEQKQHVHVEMGLVFLKNRYQRTRSTEICTLFKNCQYNLTKTCQMLDNVKTFMKSKRHVIMVEAVNKMDLKFLQEVAFIENRALIEEHVKNKELKKKRAFEKAKKKKELLECACCFNDEVLLEDIGTCNEGHLFCKDCIQRSAEVQIGDGKTTFPCLTTCDSEFSLKTLQKFLKASLLSKVLQMRQLEEVKAASIDGIEFCPYCNFATILPEEDKVFHCLNPECMKESCRLCREPNHVPKRCDEMEKSDEVKARIYIENKMTEALIRVCWNCKKSFIKEDGCNKMTCSCGAMMCYICRQKVTDYKHFNGQGGNEYHKCPLYSTNDELHVEVVKKEAMKAKQEVLQQNPSVQLKHDPTTMLPTPTEGETFPGFRMPPQPQLELPQLPIRQLDNVMNRLRDLYRYHQQRRRHERGPQQQNAHVMLFQQVQRQRGARQAMRMQVQQIQEGQMFRMGRGRVQLGPNAPAGEGNVAAPEHQPEDEGIYIALVPGHLAQVMPMPGLDPQVGPPQP